LSAACIGAQHSFKLGGIVGGRSPGYTLLVIADEVEKNLYDGTLTLAGFDV